MTINWHRLPGSVRKPFWLVTSFILCLSLVLTGTLSALAINPFIKHTGNLSLEGLRFVSDAWVIKDNGTYKMWFTHPRTEIEPSQIASLIGELDLNAIMDALQSKDIDALLNVIAGLDSNVVYDLLKDSATVIGYAASANGIDWSIENTEVLSATAELQNLAAPCVIKVNGTYHMWYSRSTTEYTRTELAALLNNLQGTSEQRIEAITTLIEGNQAVIDYATSTDGVVWVPQPDSELKGAGVYLGDNVGSPSVLFDGTQYHMWFSNVSTGISQGDIENLINNIENITIADLFALQTGVAGSIGYATSTDGITWTGVNRDVFSGGSGALNTVAAPSVIGNATDGYEMWYTYGVTGFNENDIGPILDELSAIDINQLITLLEAENYNGLIAALTQIIDYEIEETKARLAGTTTRIGYAVSADGLTWTIEDPYAVTGFAETPWASVGRPSVVKTGGVYEIWYTKGIDELTAQNLVDLWQGTISTIGYASNGLIVEMFENWNFIGLPVEPTPPETEGIFNDIMPDVRIIWSFDASSGTWHYYSNIEGAPQGDLLQMESGKGYWVEMNNPSMLILSGIEPEYPFEIELGPGWNLISIPKTPNPSNIEDVLSEIMDNLQIVWTYDASIFTWDYFTNIPGAPQGGLSNMTEGRAYWIQMTDADTLIIY